VLGPLEKKTIPTKTTAMTAAVEEESVLGT